MAARDHYARDYFEAREKFFRACEKTGVSVTTYRNPETGPGGEPLFCDVAWIGPADARKVLVICSATHGVEGFFGSAAQIGWMLDGHPGDLPPGVAVLMIHAINPYGFAWLRRVNEDNMDVNRNFVDHSNPPENPAYREFADILLPEEWTEASIRAIDAAAAAYVEKNGERAYFQAVMGGQHTHPEGLFYGGAAPCWSNRTTGEIAGQFLGGARHVVVADLHTGLGPYAYAELICRHPPQSAVLARARAWFGDAVTSPAAGESDSPVVQGNLRMAFVDLLPEAEVLAFAVEMGTRPLDQVERAVMADNWLHIKGVVDSPQGREIKAAIRDAFFPDRPDWKEPAYARTIEVFGQAIAGLAAVD